MLPCLFCVAGHRLINHPHLCCLTLMQLPRFPWEHLIDPGISKRDCDGTLAGSRATSFDPQTNMQIMSGDESGP